MKKQMKVLLLPVIAFALAAAGRLTAYGEECTYDYEEFPLERNGIALHLDCMKAENQSPAGQILLVHGSTYSSHEFDIDYQDYSLVRRLAREGYAVWRLDIAGYGQSGPVKDGFMPDTAYAAEDIHAAVGSSSCMRRSCQVWARRKTGKPSAITPGQAPQKTFRRTRTAALTGA